MTADDVAWCCSQWRTKSMDPVRGLSQSTRIVYIAHLRKLLRQINANWQSLAGLAKPTLPTPRTVVVPDEQYEAVLSIAEARCRFLLLCAREAGLRTYAAQSLRAENVIMDGSTMWLSGRTKQGGFFHVPATERLKVEVMYAMSKARPGETLEQALGPNRKPLTDAYRHQVLARAQKELGFKGRWTYHDLRRTAALKVYESTGNIRLAQQFLSHRSLQATCWYLQAGQPKLTADMVEKALRIEE